MSLLVAEKAKEAARNALAATSESSQAPPWFMVPHTKSPEDCYTNPNPRVFRARPKANYPPPNPNPLTQSAPLEGHFTHFTQPRTTISGTPRGQIKNTHVKLVSRNPKCFHKTAVPGSFQEFTDKGKIMQKLLFRADRNGEISNHFDNNFRPNRSAKDIRVLNHTLSMRNRSLRNLGGRLMYSARKLETNRITQEGYEALLQEALKKDHDPDNHEIGEFSPNEITLQRWPESSSNLSQSIRSKQERVKLPFGPSFSIPKLALSELKLNEITPGGNVLPRRPATTREYRGRLIEQNDRLTRSLTHRETISRQAEENASHADEAMSQIDAFEDRLEAKKVPSFGSRKQSLSIVF